MCMSMGALACVGACVETRGPEVNLGHCFFGALLLCCRKGLSLVAKAHQVDSAGSQQAPGIFVSVFPELGVQHVPSHLAFSMSARDQVQFLVVAQHTHNSLIHFSSLRFLFLQDL